LLEDRQARLRVEERANICLWQNFRTLNKTIQTPISSRIHLILGFSSSLVNKKCLKNTEIYDTI
jgi:hypothetical protein